VTAFDRETADHCRFLFSSTSVQVLHDAPRESDMPPGFGRSLSGSTGKGKGPMRMPNLDEAFGDR